MRRTMIGAAGVCRVGLIAVILVLFGCAGPQRSTRLTAADLDEISASIAQDFAGSELLADRTADSPRWVIAVRKLENLTSDVMSEAEKWYVMERMRSQTPLAALWRQRNIRFVLPEEKRRAVREHFDLELETPAPGLRFGEEREPTHALEGTFRSVTRAAPTGRTELYYFEATLTDLGSGEPVWSGRFEYKREARGHVWD